MEEEIMDRKISTVEEQRLCNVFERICGDKDKNVQL